MLATFRGVHSNLKKLSYLPWQNKYTYLKTFCHTKPNIFLWTKLLENLLFAEYLISVASTLNLLNVSSEVCWRFLFRRLILKYFIQSLFWWLIMRYFIHSKKWISMSVIILQLQIISAFKIIFFIIKVLVAWNIF